MSDDRGDCRRRVVPALAIFSGRLFDVIDSGSAETSPVYRRCVKLNMAVAVFGRSTSRVGAPSQNPVLPTISSVLHVIIRKHLKITTATINLTTLATRLLGKPTWRFQGIQETRKHARKNLWRVDWCRVSPRPLHQCTDARKTPQKVPFVPLLGTFGSPLRRDGSLGKALQHHEIGHDRCSAGPSQKRVRIGAPKLPYQFPLIVHYLRWLRIAARPALIDVPGPYLVSALASRDQ